LTCWLSVGWVTFMTRAAREKLPCSATWWKDRKSATFIDFIYI
jgi:hypothetical protein